jgi:hypothetical protein
MPSEMPLTVILRQQQNAQKSSECTSSEMRFCSMKVPRNLSSDTLIQLLTRFGYVNTRQTGSHNANDLESYLLVTGDRFCSSFPLFFRRNPLKHQVIVLELCAFCMMLLSRKKHHRNAIGKSITSAVKLIVFADRTSDFIHNSITSYIAICLRSKIITSIRLPPISTASNP